MFRFLIVIVAAGLPGSVHAEPLREGDQCRFKGGGPLMIARTILDGGKTVSCEWLGKDGAPTQHEYRRHELVRVEYGFWQTVIRANVDRNGYGHDRRYWWELHDGREWVHIRTFDRKYDLRSPENNPVADRWADTDLGPYWKPENNNGYDPFDPWDKRFRW